MLTVENRVTLFHKGDFEAQLDKTKEVLKAAGSIGDCVRHGFWRAACNQREEI